MQEVINPSTNGHAEFPAPETPAPKKAGRPPKTQRPNPTRTRALLDQAIARTAEAIRAEEEAMEPYLEIKRAFLAETAKKNRLAEARRDAVKAEEAARAAHLKALDEAVS